MRSTMRMSLLGCLVLSFLTLLIPPSASACSCAELPTVEEQFTRSEAVFAGRVVEVKEQKSWSGTMTKAALFKVGRIWKGGTESQIIIHTGSGGGDCGYRFEEGKEYLVYAHRSSMYGDKELLVSIICDRTNALAEAQEDLVILGKGELPTKQINLEDQLDRLHPYVWMGIVAMVIAGMVVFFVLRKGKK